jgi:dihydroorotase
VPVDEEGKKREFPYADFGAIGLETAFAASWDVLKNKASVEKMVAWLAVHPRTRFSVPMPQIEAGQTANLTIFDPDLDWTFTANDIRSKSKNSPFVGRKLTGRVLAIINNHQSEIFYRP